MALKMNDPEADRLIRELTRLTGEPPTQALIASLRERLDRQRRIHAAVGAPTLDRAIDRLAARRVLDERRDDDILSFDEHGLPV